MGLFCLTRNFFIKWPLKNTKLLKLEVKFPSWALSMTFTLHAANIYEIMISPQNKFKYLFFYLWWIFTVNIVASNFFCLRFCVLGFLKFQYLSASFIQFWALIWQSLQKIIKSANTKWITTLLKIRSDDEIIRNEMKIVCKCWILLELRHPEFLHDWRAQTSTGQKIKLKGSWYTFWSEKKQILISYTEIVSTVSLDQTTIQYL